MKFKPTRILAAFALCLLLPIAFFGLLSQLYTATPAVAQNGEEAGCQSGACISTGTAITTVTDERTAMLNGLYSSLLDDSIMLSTEEWNDLADAQININNLLTELQADLGVGDYDATLAASIPITQIVRSMAQVATDSGQIDLAAALNTLEADLSSVNGTIVLDDLFFFEIEPEALPDSNIGVLDLVSGVIQHVSHDLLTGGDTVVSISGSDLGLDSVINSVMLQAYMSGTPTYTCGSEGATFRSGAIRLKLTLDLVDTALDIAALEDALETALPLLDGIEVAASVGQIELYLETTAGTGTIETIDTVGNGITLNLTPGSANLYLGEIDDADFFDRTQTISHTTDLEYGTIGELAITTTVGIISTPVTVMIEAKSYAIGEIGVAATVPTSGALPQFVSEQIDAAYGDTLAADLMANLSLQLGTGLGGLLDPLVVPIILPQLTLDVGTDMLTPVTQLVSGLVNDLVEGIGGGLGEIRVGVDTIALLCPDLQIDLDSPLFVTSGVPFTLPIQLQNIGFYSTTETITVTAVLPPGFTLLDHNSDQWDRVGPAMRGSSETTYVFTREATIPAGSVSPPVMLEVTTPPDMTGVFTGTAGVQTAHEIVTSNNTDTVAMIVSMADADSDGVPDLFEDVNGDGDPNNDDTDDDTIPNYLDDNDDGDLLPTLVEDDNSNGSPHDDDVDGDSIPDYLEPNNVDTDSDGTFNHLDPDDDGDNINTSAEEFNNNGTPLDDDIDGDGIPNFLDDDDDDDGITTLIEDFDNSGTPLDDDSDGDGIPNYLERNDTDTDADSIVNHLDEDDDGDELLTADEDVNNDNNFFNDDSDGDGKPDYLDSDTDNDGVDNAQEDPNGDGNLQNDDSDGDGTPNYKDNDDDNDGASTLEEDTNGDHDASNDDNDSDTVPNYLESRTADADSDSVTNENDDDDDNNFIPTSMEDSNGSGSVLDDDTDGDGTPDYLDLDDDGDGINDIDEDSNGNNDITDDDADGDSIPDYLESNSNDFDGDGTPDVNDDDDDGDGIPTLDEDLNTDGNPFNDDTDGDGIPDFLEPNNVDTDDDGLFNHEDADDDGDGVPTSDENLDSSDFYNPVDTDGDGIPDYLDDDDDGDGILTIDEDTNGDGDPTNDDSDGDGIPDYLDNYDGEGVIDTVLYLPLIHKQ